MPNEIQRDHTPRSSSSQAHLHPSHGRAGHQAPLQTYYQPSQPTQHGTRRSRSPDVRHRSRAENTNEPQPPSQSVLLSTQTQLERLKSEVAHLDELVNRLKSQHIPLDQAQPPSTNHNDGQTYQIQHQQNLNEHEQDNEAAMKAAEEADHIRRTREYESSPASQNDLLRLVRHLDSLVWMRNPHTYTEGAEVRKGNQHEKIGNGISIGKGTRNDDIIFTKGNLDHLARRMGAWENIVRRKEEEARYNYGT
jgi:exonuclease VII small subunit